MEGMTQLFGWTLPQYAKAAAWYAGHIEPLPAANLDGARKVQHTWRFCRTDQPTIGAIAGVQEKLDYEWAADAFADAARECWHCQ